MEKDKAISFNLSKYSKTYGVKGLRPYAVRELTISRHVFPSIEGVRRKGASSLRRKTAIHGSVTIVTYGVKGFRPYAVRDVTL